jgi:hypothetical protein
MAQWNVTELITNSVTEQSGAKSKIKPPPPSAAVEVTASNFDEVVLNNDKDVLVAFTAPWVCQIHIYMRQADNHSVVTARHVNRRESRTQTDDSEHETRLRKCRSSIRFRARLCCRTHEC